MPTPKTASRRRRACLQNTILKYNRDPNSFELNIFYHQLEIYGALVTIIMQIHDVLWGFAQECGILRSLRGRTQPFESSCKTSMYKDSHFHSIKVCELFWPSWFGKLAT